MGAACFQAAPLAARCYPWATKSSSSAASVSPSSGWLLRSSSSRSGLEPSPFEGLGSPSPGDEERPVTAQSVSCTGRECELSHPGPLPSS